MARLDLYRSGSMAFSGVSSLRENRSPHSRDGWHLFLCALFCLLTILPFGYAESITESRAEAEDGDVQGQSALAKAYHRGEGVPKDEEKAVQWWEKAAEHGNVSAHVSLGGVYSQERAFQRTTLQPCAGGRRPPSKAM